MCDKTALSLTVIRSFVVARVLCKPGERRMTAPFRRVMRCGCTICFPSDCAVACRPSLAVRLFHSDDSC